MQVKWTSGEGWKGKFLKWTSSLQNVFKVFQFLLEIIWEHSLNQIKQAKAYTVEHMCADGSYRISIYMYKEESNHVSAMKCFSFDFI